LTTAENLRLANILSKKAVKRLRTDSRGVIGAGRWELRKPQ
jgi:hypothetical protein